MRFPVVASLPQKLESGIREIFSCGIWNPVNSCLWNLEFEKFLLVESGIREILACGIRNPRNSCLWNPEYWALDSGIHFKESGIPLTIRIQNPSSTEKEFGIQHLESGIHGVESRIQHCPEFPCFRIKLSSKISL